MRGGLRKFEKRPVAYGKIDGNRRGGGGDNTLVVIVGGGVVEDRGVFSFFLGRRIALEKCQTHGGFDR